IWPDAVFIHIVRDGRDVARSCINMGWAGDGWHAADRWLKAETLWDQLKLQLPENRRLEVRFEELILNTSDTLDRICQYISGSSNSSVDLRYHPAMMNYANGTEYSLPNARLVNQWHHKGSKREIQLIESRIAPMLVERGYELSGLPHLRVSRWGRTALKLQNKWGILNSRAQKYGLPLVSADLLARRLRLNGLSDRIRKKINVIDINNMKQSW
ncbi:MAG: sulfotransferase, partial [Cyanobacteria bacterium J06649_4]